MAAPVKDIYDKLKEEFAVHNYYSLPMPFLEIKGGDYKARYITFTDCEFQELVHFDKVELSCGLLFENCRFKGPLVFSNVSVSQYDVLLNPDSQSIVFKKCSFDSIVKFEGKNEVIDRTLLFEDSTFTEGLDIGYLNIGTEGLTIRKCTINRKLDLFNITTKQDISLASNEVKTFCRIESASCITLTILSSNNFQENLHIRDSQTIRGIVFNNGVFGKEVYINQVFSRDSGLTIIGSVFEKAVFVNFHVNNSRPLNGLYSFYFSDSKFNNGIYVNGKNDLFADEPSIEKIELDISAELKGDIVFRDLQVGILSLSGYNSSANLLFEHLFINQIRIKALINNAGLVLSGIKASHLEWFEDKEFTRPRDNALYIDDSNFGKAQFYQVDFSSFGKVVFHNNILTEITTSLVKWFTPAQLENGIEESSLQIYKKALESKDERRITNASLSLVATYRSRQEIYRQLKYSSQKQGNTPESLEFQRHEMNYYRKIINIKKPRNWSEYLILWSNQSNDFGQNWLKPLCLLIFFSLISYLPIGFLTSSRLDYSRFADSFSDIALNFKVVFWDNLKTWLVLLNPAHRLSDVSDKINEFSSWVYFWDLLSRIIVSYFIFQMISAFRKFNK